LVSDKPGPEESWQENFACCNTCSQLIPLFMVESHSEICMSLPSTEVVDHESSNSLWCQLGK
jgi:hypothetical protein